MLDHGLEENAGRQSSLPLVSGLSTATHRSATRKADSRRLGRLAAFFLSAWLTVVAIRWVVSSGHVALYDITAGGGQALVVSKDYSDKSAANPGRWGRERDGRMPTDKVLILCPMKNGIEHIWSFFHNVDSLNYPRHQIHLGFLVSDSSDRTWERLHELVNERQRRASRSQRYGRVSMFKKDFVADGEGEVVQEGDDLQNVGKPRHDFGVQIARRTLLAKSRSWLLNAAMTPDIDWVLWVDIDVDEYPKTLIQDLIAASARENAPVVAPNCMWKTYDDIGPYDRNYWWETPESKRFKETIGRDDILVEGYKDVLDTHRQLLGESYDYKSQEAASKQPSSYRLDGVGGCCTFVHASVHREGAVFPAYAFDNQIETEGFAQMAKRLRKKIVGLPTYHVYHGLYG